MATPAEETKEDTLETRSRLSGSSYSSQRTSSTTAAARARAKAEATRVKISFAQKGADILKHQAEQLKKKADLDADLQYMYSNQRRKLQQH